jgi:hypothetical protein
MANRLARKNTPQADQRIATAGMVAAGEFLQVREFYLNADIRSRLLANTPLLLACFQAREEAALVKTRLSAVRPRHAARVVASGYLNACLNHYGATGFAEADDGMRRLIEALGPEAQLSEWWEEVKRTLTSDCEV